MGDYIHLLIHNIICITSAVGIFGAILFTYLNGPKKPANILWSLTLLVIEIFIISHVIGVNISDPILSYNVLKWNMAMFFIGSFNVHAVLAIADLTKKKRWIIITYHTMAGLLIAFFLIFPDFFSLPSVPKMYFPNYYNPGALNFIRVLWLYAACAPLVLSTLYNVYRNTDKNDTQKRGAALYLFVATVIGYVLGAMPNFLVYNINFDPIWGMSFGAVFAVPFVYGAVRYGLFDVKVIAKQAAFYSIGVVLVGGLITVLNYVNQSIVNANPNFPIWVTPLVSAMIAVTLGVFIWRQLRQSDLLKYEFVTTATHKFRTPLTHIKWAAENLAASPTLSSEERTQVEYIQGSNVKLVELTGLLMNVASSEDDSFQYNLQKEDLSIVTEEVIASLSNQLAVKKMSINRTLQPDCNVKCDTAKIKFIIQTFIENAVHYTGPNPTITVSVYRNANNIVCAVRDNGIGIPKAEVNLLFAKFYRGRRARLADTEGMGIGLFVSKQIIERHNGKIWAESEGEGKGSTFAFSLPAVK